MNREAFSAHLRLAFDEIEVGRTFTYRRTFTDGDVAIFCGVTGDFNPYHTDRSFAEASWYGRPPIPGLLTGSMLTHIGGLLGFLATEMSFEFVAPVFAGDTIECTLTFTEKDAERRRMRAAAEYRNLDGILVARGTLAGFPGDVRLAR